MTYLRNTWYCAGFPHELDDEKHLGRKMLDENILLYRKQDGTAIAIGDRCPHRFAPLSMGKRTGDIIACPYHGLQFNSEGDCVLNPNEGGVIPKACKVPSYPLEEKWGILWIWMGDPEKVDVSMIPDFSMQVEGEGFSVVRGHHITKANYQLVVDNLMDRTHVEFMHPLLQHSGERPDNFERVQSVDQMGNTIWDYHAELNTPAYPMLKALWPDHPDDGMESYFNVRWEPPTHMLLDTGTVKMGTDRKVGAHNRMANLITPIDENNTHYFWTMQRDQNIGNPEVDAKVQQGVTNTFKNEDGVIVAACAEYMGTNDMMGLNPVLLATDVSAIRARRILAKLIDEENEAAAV